MPQLVTRHRWPDSGCLREGAKFYAKVEHVFRRVSRTLHPGSGGRGLSRPARGTCPRGPRRLWLSPGCRSAVCSKRAFAGRPRPVRQVGLGPRADCASGRLTAVPIGTVRRHHVPRSRRRCSGLPSARSSSSQRA